MLKRGASRLIKCLGDIANAKTILTQTLKIQLMILNKFKRNRKKQEFTR